MHVASTVHVAVVLMLLVHAPPRMGVAHRAVPHYGMQGPAAGVMAYVGRGHRQPRRSAEGPRRFVLRLSGGGDEGNGDAGRSPSPPECEGPEPPGAAGGGRPAAKSFLKVADNGEVWVEKEGQGRALDPLFDDEQPRAAKVVESIDLGVDAECPCAYCTGGNSDGDGAPGACVRAAGAKECPMASDLAFDIPPHLERALRKEVRTMLAACSEAASDSAPAGCSTAAPDETGDSAHGNADAAVKKAGDGWEFKGGWQGGRHTGAGGCGEEAQGEVEWEDEGVETFDPASQAAQDLASREAQTLAEHASLHGEGGQVLPPGAAEELLECMERVEGEPIWWEEGARGEEGGGGGEVVEGPEPAEVLHPSPAPAPAPAPPASSFRKEGGGWGVAGEEARDQWVLARLERERVVCGAGWGAWKRPMGWAGVEGAV